MSRALIQKRFSTSSVASSHPASLGLSFPIESLFAARTFQPRIRLVIEMSFMSRLARHSSSLTPDLPN